MICWQKVDGGNSLPPYRADSHLTINVSFLYCLPHHRQTVPHQCIKGIGEGGGMRLTNDSVPPAYPSLQVQCTEFAKKIHIVT
jgi:hypothetical protein